MYTKKQPISGLIEGDRVEDIFVVKIKKAVIPYARGYRFNLILSDSSGMSIQCTYWGESDQELVRRVAETIKPDSVVFIRGTVQDFNGKLMISVNPPDSIIPLKEGDYSRDDFVSPPRRNIEEMSAEFVKYIEGVKNPQIKAVLERMFLEDSAFMEKFRTHPAAIEIHHNWRGGLLQHTLEVLRYCDISKELFPQMDSDLLTAGAILHDIGKTDELEVTSRIKATEKGQLKSHISLGYARVLKVMDKLNTPEGIRNKLLHIILSHHGNLEYGSPKEPMFPEAVAVYFADELSSKLTQFIDFQEFAKKATEDSFMYSNRLGRNVYLK